MVIISWSSTGCVCGGGAVRVLSLLLMFRDSDGKFKLQSAKKKKNSQKSLSLFLTGENHFLL